MRTLRRRYGHAKVTPEQRAALLRDALLDWRSGRAFVRQLGRNDTDTGWRMKYMLHPLTTVAGMVIVGHGRATTAPWSKVAIEEWGHTTDGLHKASHAAYPDIKGQQLLNKMVGQ